MHTPTRRGTRTHTHVKLLAFHDSSGYVHAPQCYVVYTLSVLLLLRLLHLFLTSPLCATCFAYLTARFVVFIAVYLKYYEMLDSVFGKVTPDVSEDAVTSIFRAQQPTFLIRSP